MLDNLLGLRPRPAQASKAVAGDENSVLDSAFTRVREFYRPRA